MNKLLTIVFSAYQSHALLKKVLNKLPTNYKILIIENSLDKNLKKTLEKKFKHVEVIVPKKNLGLAKSYNLGLKRSKSKYVFLNNPDHDFNNQAVKKLIECAEKIKDFGIIAPTYKKEKVFKNYEIYQSKNNLDYGIYKKFGVTEVDIIDNCFFIKKKNIKDNAFDENFFLYFETFDFCKNLSKNNKKLYVCNKIKYHHPGSKSASSKFVNIVSLTRAFHYNWSKFYYYKKNYGIFLAYRKIIPNLIKSLRKIISSAIILNKSNTKEGLIELYGIVSAILSLKSFYRPKK
jgi:N-acetylglucosaminyl-diphospho-decaprenol L-rhamnosyltransferase